MVSIHEVGIRITECADCIIGLATGIDGVRPHNLVLAVGFVPDRNETYGIFLRSLDQCRQLRSPFVRESVTNPK